MTCTTAVRAALAAACLLPFSGAFARSAELPALADSAATNWSGAYAGLLLGYGWAEGTLSAPGDEEAGDFDGASGGAVIGYNWQSGRVVFGIEGDIMLHEIRGDLFSDPPTTYTADTLYSAHLRGRLGYDFGRVLPYIAAGYATGETFTAIRGIPPAGLIAGESHRTHGWTVGAGADVRLGETFVGPLILRAEYLYADMGRETVFEAVTGGAGLGVETGTHFARIGVISHLGGVGNAPLAPPAEVTDWSGAYGGLLVGYSRTDVETDLLGGPMTDYEADGISGGLYVGYNLQFGSLVAGLEGSVALADVEGRGLNVAGVVDHSYRGNVAADARLRVGYAFGRVLPFIAGGVRWTRSEQAFEHPSFPFPFQDGRVPSVAWTIGAGADYRVSDRISLRGEYLYARDEDASTPYFPGPGLTITQNIESHQIRVGAAYHF